MRLARTLVVCLIFGTLSPGAFLQEKKSAWDRISSHFAPPEGYRDSAGKYDSLLKFSDGRPVNTAEDWRARRQEILKTWQTLLGAWPPLLENPMLKVLEKESVESFTRYKVEIDIAPGRTTVAYLLVPPRKGPFTCWPPDRSSRCSPETRWANPASPPPPSPRASSFSGPPKAWSPSNSGLWLTPPRES